MPTATEPLSREAILSMPAGRKMDVLIACRVTKEYCDEPMLLEMARNGEFDERPGSVKDGCHDGETFIIGPPCYSTDIAAAWQVVEKMCPKPDGLCQWIHVQVSHVERDGKEFWACKFQLDHARADTPMLAICRAALLTTVS